MALFKLGGSGWTPKLVGWGTPGPQPTRELLGYVPTRLWGRGNGAMSSAQRAAQTVNVWSIPALYALYKGDTLLHVGQTDSLGARLLAHHASDHLAERWDTFSWLSPVGLEVDGRRRFVGVSAARPARLEAPRRGAFLDEMEALCVLVGRPFENRQQPWHDATWLYQVRSAHAELDGDEIIGRLAAEVASLRDAISRK